MSKDAGFANKHSDLRRYNGEISGIPRAGLSANLSEDYQIQSHKNSSSQQQLKSAEAQRFEFPATIGEVPVDKLIELLDAYPQLPTRESQRFSILFHKHFGSSREMPKTVGELTKAISGIESGTSNTASLLVEMFKNLQDTFIQGTDNNKNLKKILSAAESNLELPATFETFKSAYSAVVNRQSQMTPSELIEWLGNPGTKKLYQEFKQNWPADKIPRIERVQQDFIMMAELYSAGFEETMKSKKMGMIAQKLVEVYENYSGLELPELNYPDRILGIPAGLDSASYSKQLPNKSDEPILDEKINRKIEILKQLRQSLNIEVFDFLDSFDCSAMIEDSRLQQAISNPVCKEILRIFKVNGHFESLKTENRISAQREYYSLPPLLKLERWKELQYFDQVEDILENVSAIAELNKPALVVGKLQSLSPKFFEKAGKEFLFQIIKNHSHGDSDHPFEELQKSGFGDFLDMLAKEFPGEINRKDGLTYERFTKYVSCYQAGGLELLKQYKGLYSGPDGRIDTLILDYPQLMVGLCQEIKTRFPQIKLGNLPVYLNMKKNSDQNDYQTRYQELVEYVNRIRNVLYCEEAGMVYRLVENSGENAQVGIDDFAKTVERLQKQDPVNRSVEALLASSKINNQELYETVAQLRSNVEEINPDNRKFDIGTLFTAGLDKVHARKDLMADSTYREYLKKYFSDPNLADFRTDNPFYEALYFGDSWKISDVKTFDTVFRQLSDIEIPDDVIFRVLSGIDPAVNSPSKLEKLKSLIKDKQESEGYDSNILRERDALKEMRQILFAK